MRGFGVSPDTKALMRISKIYVRDGAVVLGSFGVSALSMSAFPANQVVAEGALFIINLIFSIWLCLRPSTNPGKRNYELLLNDIILRKKYFRSLTRSNYLEDDEQIGGFK